MEFFLSVFVTVLMIAFTVSAPSIGNTVEQPVQEIAVPGTGMAAHGKEIHAGYGNQNTQHQGLNLEELLLLKAILDQELGNMVDLPKTLDPPPERKIEDGNQFDPVFGKIRDFLDELSVEDLERAVAKLKARHQELENEENSNQPSDNQIELKEQIPLKKSESGPCDITFENAIATGETGNLPYCDEDGFYVTKQCAGSICYCVDKYGSPTMGQAPLWQANELVCDKQESMDDAIEELRGLLNGKKPWEPVPHNPR